MNTMVVVVAGVMVQEDKVLLARRMKQGLEPDKWEFPGGKIEKGESPEQALERELSEELGIATHTGKLLEAIVHPSSPYEGLELLILYYYTQILSGEPIPIECSDARWVARGQLDDYSLLATDRDFLHRMHISHSRTLFQNDI